jgi:hypothetical protein
MLENAVRLCDAKFGSINRWDGEALHLVATYNVPPDFAEFRKRTPFRPGPENPISRMLMTKTVEAIKAGKAYYGEVPILGTPYITGYEPIKDGSGAEIGIYYVGYKK